MSQRNKKIRPLVKVSNLRKINYDKKNLDLWSKIVKKRANYVCEYPGCNKRDYLNSHHIYSRIHSNTRYDPDVGICLCPTHHTLGQQAAHKDPDFKDIIIKNRVRTQEFYDNLRKKAYQTVKNDLTFKKKWFEYLMNFDI